MGYSVIVATLLVSFGRLSDIFGRVRLYSLGFAIFTAASILLFFTPGQGQYGGFGSRHIPHDPGGRGRVSVRQQRGHPDRCIPSLRTRDDSGAEPDCFHQPFFDKGLAAGARAVTEHRKTGGMPNTLVHGMSWPTIDVVNVLSTAAAAGSGFLLSLSPLDPPLLGCRSGVALLRGDSFRLGNEDDSFCRLNLRAARAG